MLLRDRMVHGAVFVAPIAIALIFSALAADSADSPGAIPLLLSVAAVLLQNDPFVWGGLGAVVACFRLPALSWLLLAYTASAATQALGWMLSPKGDPGAELHIFIFSARAAVIFVIGGLAALALRLFRRAATT